MNLSPNQRAAWVRKYKQVSESTLALTFAEQYGDRWSYNTDKGVWLKWVDTHWARRQTPQLLDALRHFLTEFAIRFREGQIITPSEAVKLQSHRTLVAVEKLCRNLPSFLRHDAGYDADPFMLGTPAGTIDLCTGEMRKAIPEDYITVITPIAPAPKGTKLGPMFKKFLHDITSGDKDFQKTLQQWFGISAQGTSRDQKVLFLYGEGGNGKGVLLRTVAHLLSEHAINAPRDMLMAQRHSQHSAVVDVLYARMAIATEVDDDATWDTILVKDITGGDKMSVRRLYENFTLITPRCSLTVSGNRKPALKGIDDAVKRRFLVGTFKFKVEKVIPDLEKIFIEKEGPAILRWIIDGSVQREREGQLFVAPVILEDTADYFAEENVMQDFINTYMEPAPAGIDPPWEVKTSEVYAAWKAFCSSSGRAAGAKNSFTTAMRASGIGYRRGENGRYFLNYHLRLVPDGPGMGG
jgi:putative DNA primase/helicase